MQLFSKLEMRWAKPVRLFWKISYYLGKMRAVIIEFSTYPSYFNYNNLTNFGDKKTKTLGARPEVQRTKI